MLSEFIDKKLAVRIISFCLMVLILVRSRVYEAYGPRPRVLRIVGNNCRTCLRNGMKYWVYVLRSKQDKQHYVGLTANVETPLKYHNAGRVRSTRHRIPFELLYKEDYATRAEARTREKYLKSYAGSKEKKAIIERCRIV